MSRFFGMSFLPSIEATTPRLSVMTYNTKNLADAQGKKSASKDKYQVFRDYLVEKQIEVVALQEVSEKVLRKVRSENIHPYHFGIENNISYILSKYPIVNSGGEKFTKSGNSVVWADIKAPFGIFRFISIHLQSNKVSSQTALVIDEFQEEFNWTNIRNILSSVKASTNQRVDQAEAVKALVVQSPYPLILCGDFNETPQSYIYHLLKGEMEDAFTAKGIGISSTYAGKIPGLKIDHILYNNSFEAINCTVDKVHFSDHYPVIANLAYTP